MNFSPVVKAWIQLISLTLGTAITVATTGTFTSVTYNVEGDITKIR